jgi:hypothetical protein
MARGGFRSGSGRKKGSKNRKAPEKPETLVFLSKAEEFAQFYGGMLSRASSGKKPTESEKQQMMKLAAELTKTYESGWENEGKPVEELLPLDFMLKLMNDPGEDKEMRARMAQAAAPYCHPRIADGKGKKDEKKDKAKAAGSGKFAPAPAPLKLVK